MREKQGESDRENEREAVVVMLSYVFFLWEVVQPFHSTNTHMHEHTPMFTPNHTHTHTGGQRIF